MCCCAQFAHDAVHMQNERKKMMPNSLHVAYMLHTCICADELCTYKMYTQATVYMCNMHAASKLLDIASVQHTNKIFVRIRPN